MTSSAFYFFDTDFALAVHKIIDLNMNENDEFGVLNMRSAQHCDWTVHYRKNL